jgi:hypothetical protein
MNAKKLNVFMKELRRKAIGVYTSTLIATLVLTGSSTMTFSQTNVVDGKDLQPTEALFMIFSELKTQPDKQGEIGKRILQKTRTTDLSPDEEFALAEVYFVSLMGGEAKQLFPKFVEGEGLHARIARQRLMRMKFVIDEKIDEVEKELYAYRAQLKPIKQDLVHTSSIAASLARHYQTKGDFDKAVKLITDELEATPLDAPYFAFMLPATFFTSFEKAGKRDTALRLLEKSRDAMRELVVKNRALLENQDDKPSATHVAHRFYRLEYRLLEALPEEKALAIFNKTQFDRLESAIAQLTSSNKKEP